MKKIYWIMFDKEILFRLNWLEYLVMKHIFHKRKYDIKQSKKEIIGQKYDMLVVDELAKE